jgi:hypothetical protein
MRTGAVIPARDEEATIGGVVRALRAAGVERVVVVDNGSRDRTSSEARVAGAEVVSEPQAGYGRACARGIAYLDDSVDRILFCDGDGSDDPADVSRLLAASDAGADLVLGDRRAGAAGRAVLAPVQNFGNALATTLIGLGWGTRFRDLGPLRVVRREALERIGMQDRGFGWTVEMQARAAELGLVCMEIPVNYRKRQGGRSKISGTVRGSAMAGMVILETLGRLWLQRAAVKRWLPAGSLLLLAVGMAAMVPFGDLLQPGAVAGFLTGAAVACVGFLMACAAGRVSMRRFWIVAVALRLLLLPMAPGDDVWRYIWEGRVQRAGFSPHALAPDAPALASLRDAVWERMPHRSIPAVYPPAAQAVFRWTGAVSESVGLLKLVFVLADLGVCALLVCRAGTHRALWYAWSPLVVYSFAGGAHFDSLMLLPLVAAVLLAERGTAVGRVMASVLGALSVGIKWVSLPFLGWLGLAVRRRNGWWSGAWVAVGGLATLGVIFAGLLADGGLRSAISPDFTLYARSAELLPALIGPHLPWTSWGNAVYAIPLVLWGLWRAWVERDGAWFVCGWFLAMLVCSPCVHAWYFTWPLALGALVGSRAALLGSVSCFAYFWLQRTSALGGAWEQGPWEKIIMWGPVLAGLAWDLVRHWLRELETR